MDTCSAVMLSGHKPQVADAVIEALATSEMSRFKEGLCESEHDDRCKECQIPSSESLLLVWEHCQNFFCYLSDCCWNGISMM